MLQKVIGVIAAILVALFICKKPNPQGAATTGAPQKKPWYARLVWKV